MHLRVFRIDRVRRKEPFGLFHRSRTQITRRTGRRRHVLRQVSGEKSRLALQLYYLGVQRCDPLAQARRDSTDAQHCIVLYSDNHDSKTPCRIHAEMIDRRCEITAFFCGLLL
jgi:hypothetical protein